MPSPHSCRPSLAQPAAAFVPRPSARERSSVNVTSGGTILGNVETTGINRLVSISGTTGVTKTFSSALSDSLGGDDGGVSLTNTTGATIAFSGEMTHATGTASAFTASGGGTITVTGGSNNIAASGPWRST